MKIPKEHAMLLDVQYIKPKKGQNDHLYIIWKDLRDDSKHLQVIPEPMVDIYFEKPEYRDHDYNKNYHHIENLDRRVVKYKDIPLAIAEDAGENAKQTLYNAFRSGDRKTVQSFYVYPYVFGADGDIRAWYRYQWLKSYDNDKPKKIKKSYLDIECDIMEATGLPDPSSNPVDLVTVIDGENNISYTFALIGVVGPERDLDTLHESLRKNELEKRKLYQSRIEQQNYLVEHQEVLQQACHAKFDEKYPNMEYKFFFYKDERKLITHLFQLVNYHINPDFVEIWNMPFDMPYLRERLEVLGLDPTEIICHKDFPVKECYFKKDRINFAVKNKADWFYASAYTIYTDQMRNYAAIRKGQQELRSNKLTYIAKKELKDEKLDYSEVSDLKTLSCKNYLMYILYNIKDVLLQKGIEEKTNDLETFYYTSYLNITPYENEFKQTVKLRNVQYKYYLSDGLVPGENVNGFLYNYKEEREEDDYEDDDEEEDDSSKKKNKKGFEGALVGNPLLNGNFGMELFGKKTNNLFQYSVDMDMSAFYPSTIQVMNIDPSTLIFKVILDASQFKCRGGKLNFNGITDVQCVKENSDSFENDVAKEAFDNYQTRNVISTGHKWLNLPSVGDVYERLLRKVGK